MFYLLLSFHIFTARLRPAGGLKKEPPPVFGGGSSKFTSLMLPRETDKTRI